MVRVLCQKGIYFEDPIVRFPPSSEFDPPVFVRSMSRPDPGWDCIPHFEPLYRCPAGGRPALEVQMPF